MPEERRNLIVAIVLSMLVLITWQLLFTPTEVPEADQQSEAAQSGTPGTTPAPASNASPLGVPLPFDSPDVGNTVPLTAPVDRTKRVSIDNAKLSGNLDRRGMRIDDLLLKGYRETIDEDSRNIRLFSPTGSSRPYYAEFGWVQAPGSEATAIPTPDTVWEFAHNSATAVQPGVPITLEWTNDDRVRFEVVIELDQHYMFTVSQRVQNQGAKTISLAPYGLVSRTGTPNLLGFYLLHEGLIGAVDERLKEVDYDDLVDEKLITHPSGTSWIGITDKYWLAALVPSNPEENTARMVAGKRNSIDLYQVDSVRPFESINPGGSTNSVVRLYAGAKEVTQLDNYSEQYNIPLFDRAVDFGWFYFITKPMFKLLQTIHSWAGNFGVSILILTVIVKIAFLPLVYKSYKSMARIRELQPEIEKLKANAGDDRQRQQKNLMALYKKHKVNPVAGCLPMLVQLPVFFSLYKVLFVTIEMRHAPFFGWIRDLSVPDPAGILTVFGWVPWDVPAVLSLVNLGIWPLIFGLTMFLQQRVMPQPTDPMQKRIFGLFPFVFTFLLAGFPAGLVIYWSWNNTLTIIQQLAIQRFDRPKIHRKISKAQ